MNAVNLTLDKFLSAFFNGDERVCLRVFDDKKRGAFKGAKLETPLDKIQDIEPTLRKHNKQGRGIYFVINYGGHEDGEISRVNAQFVECDSLSIKEQLAQIDAFPLQPSIIVKTQKSLHCYWLMKDARLDSFRRVQKRLIKQFNGDPVCINESRVFRLPSFYHNKGEPVLVECIKFDPALRYTQAELENVLPEVAETPPPHNNTLPRGTRSGMALVGKRCLFIQYCKENAAKLPEHDWYAMITNLAVFEGGERAIHALSKSYPKYSYEETQGKITHFFDSGTKPMTCAKIAEKGFKCPRLETGECEVKSPAALCYRPIDVATLRNFLTEQDVVKNAMDNVQAAQSFIADYLFNVEGAIAEPFINYEIKEHFRLKGNDTRALVAYYKDAYRRYAENKETLRETTAVELPEWYEPTERGGLRFISGILADYMTKNVDVIYSAGSFFFYLHGVYIMQNDLAAQALVRSFMITRSASMTAIIDCLGQWKMSICKEVDEINCNPYIVNVQNGLLNVLDNSFSPHTPEYYSTVQISANYDPTAKCPRFMEFISNIIPEPEGVLLQEIFGYLLIPVNKAQKSFVFVGAPNAGKSTLLSVAQEILLGSDNVSNVPWQALGDRFNKAELFGKLANIFADLPSKKIDDGGMFKALTGEDYITAERKNRDPFTFRPYARLLFSCNEIPRNYSDRSDGFYRRLIIIRFDNSIPQSNRDPNLREKFQAERDGILMWAVEGLKRLIANSYQFSETEATRRELQRYKVESNSALLFFEECCELEDDAEVPREVVFERYRDYCNKNGLRAMSQMAFNSTIEKAGTGIRRSVDRLAQRRTWRGMRLKA